MVSIIAFVTNGLKIVIAVMDYCFLNCVQLSSLYLSIARLMGAGCDQSPTLY